jgi:predicted ribosome quality control (RQC) complex YloA/Tae2 family protein
MSFDAFMTRAVAHELNEKLSGARVEKVLQPSKDEIAIALHKGSEHFKLQINAGAGSPRISLTNENAENPKVPPMFCMLMRKHLTGAKIEKVFQHGFERVIEIALETYDEMGYYTLRRIVVEIMGRYSNAVLCDADYKILGVLRPVDFTTSRKRQMLPQMRYELPPCQDKRDPLAETKDSFLSVFDGKKEISEKDILNTYIGFSPLTAKEVVLRGENDVFGVWGAFETLIEDTLNGNFTPTLLLDANGKPVDFSCFEIRKAADGDNAVQKNTFGELIDGFFAENERRAREKSRAHATEKVLKNALARIEKKLMLQRKELKDTEKKAEYKQKADLITANIYRFNGKTSKINVIDYVEDGQGGYNAVEVEIVLENGMSAPAAAQKLYKKYAKAKNAEQMITLQIQKGEQELKYMQSVLDALERAVGQVELDEIRAELTEMGYIRSKTAEKHKNGKPQKPAKLQGGQPIKLTTSSGMTVLVGKNNLQNDRLTFKIASKNDYWFHVKNIPGSHTVLVCDGNEPSETDIEEAAVIAAKNSKAADQDRAEVDYTRIKNVKKPSGARPGLVIYDNYKAAVVDPRK